MEIKNLFEQAVINSKSLPERPGNEMLLKLYAAFKQATEGDIHIDAPTSPFDFAAKAKYNAWEKLKGTTAIAAMQEYTLLVDGLMDKRG